MWRRPSHTDAESNTANNGQPSRDAVNPPVDLKGLTNPFITPRISTIAKSRDHTYNIRAPLIT